MERKRRKRTANPAKRGVAKKDQNFFFLVLGRIDP
jgi:hypothetical protein